MKYRRLAQDELLPLQKEFIDFLVVNGIDADTWEKKLKHQSTTYDRIIDAFSDVVFEKIIRNTQFLLRRERSILSAVDCRDATLHMITITTDNSNVDLRQDIQISEIIDDITITKGTKESTQRELDIWQLLERGYTIDKKGVYAQLAKQI